MLMDALSRQNLGILRDDGIAARCAADTSLNNIGACAMGGSRMADVTGQSRCRTAQYSGSVVRSQISTFRTEDNKDDAVLCIYERPSSTITTQIDLRLIRWMKQIASEENKTSLKDAFSPLDVGGASP
jgi:hypothetical protein